MLLYSRYLNLDTLSLTVIFKKLYTVAIFTNICIDNLQRDVFLILKFSTLDQRLTVLYNTQFNPLIRDRLCTVDPYY